jgi:hypothetical protein
MTTVNVVVELLNRVAESTNQSWQPLLNSARSLLHFRPTSPTFFCPLALYGVVRRFVQCAGAGIWLCHGPPLANPVADLKD